MILELIKDDPAFHGPHSIKQFPIEIQLIIVLRRLGCFGEFSSKAKIANFFGIGDGGTISIITARVFKVILKLKNEFLFWPNKDERDQIATDT